MKISCKNCDCDVEALISAQGFKGGEHIRADCPTCGKWIKWFAKYIVVTPKQSEAQRSFVRPTLESITAKAK